MSRSGSNRTRAKTAQLAFPPPLPNSDDGPDYFSSKTHQKGYSSTLPFPWPKDRQSSSLHTAGQASSSTSLSTLFPYPPLPLQNPKLKLLKSGGPKLNSFLDQIFSKKGMTLPAAFHPPGPKPLDNKVIKTTITIPILPHKFNNRPKLSKRIKQTSATTTTPSKDARSLQHQRKNTTSLFEKHEVSQSPPVPGEHSKNPSPLLSPLIGAKMNEGNKEKTGKHHPSNLDRFKVTRTEEERKSNPECIRLEKLGLKQVPIIGAEENQVKVLSLQHNLISRLDNLPSLIHLLVLDLYNNRIERITGLHIFVSLKVLLLGKNRIRRIEGLDGLKRLEILDLHGNQLRYVDNLASLSSLRVLNLAGNLLRTIRNLGPYGLSSLTELNLKRNRIRNLDGLQKAPHIKKLFLANNDLQSMSSLQPLKKLIFLQELLLESNPLCSVLDYTCQIITLFPYLDLLDRVNVTDQMRADAKTWHKRRLVEEEERRREIEKLHANFPSSRDEVIFEAKRRWESVKHFVRSNPVDQDVLADYRTAQKLSKMAKSISESQMYFENSFVEETLLEPEPVSGSVSGDSDPVVDGMDVLDLSEGSSEKIPEESNVTETNTPINSKKEDSKAATSNNSLTVGRGVRNLKKVISDISEELVSENNELEQTNLPHLEENLEVILPRRELPVFARPTPKSTKVAVVRPVLRSSRTINDPVPPIIANPNFRNSLPILNDPNAPTLEIPEMTTEIIQEAEIRQEVQEKAKNEVSGHHIQEVDEIKPEMDNIPQIIEEKSETPTEQRAESRQSLTPSRMLRRSKSEYDMLDTAKDHKLEDPVALPSPETKRNRSLLSWRSSSIDANLFPSGESETSDVESVATSTNASDISSRRQIRRQTTRPKWRVKTGLKRSESISNFSGRRPSTCFKDKSTQPLIGAKQLRRVDSASNLEVSAPPILKRQGSDYLVEIDGKVLSVYGQGALKHALQGFSTSITSIVTSANFHFISYDVIIPFFGKLKQFYPALDNFQFRSNNILTLGQMNALSDLQGIVSLQIFSEGNPITENPFWKEYAIYRLSHWGLQFVNGMEVTSEYRGSGRINLEADYKMFDSLGYLALSCLPQSALKPLAKRLHTLHCFCCCSSSSSSDESGKKKTEPNSEKPNGKICNAWDDDPVLLDVIGKEGLVYTPPDSGRGTESQDTGVKIINSGQHMLQKLEMLDKIWPTMMYEAIQDILTDYMFMDSYMKKGLKRVNDEVLSIEKLK